MLTFSFGSVFITIVTSNLLIILIYLIFRNTKLMVQMGYKLLGVFALCTVLRLAFPFEFPISTNIYFPKFFSKLFSDLCYPFFPIGKPVFSIWHFCLLFWAVGTVYQIYRYLRSCRSLQLYIKSHCREVTNLERYYALSEQICREEKRQNRFRIMEAKFLPIPLVCFFKVPYILIPCDLKLSDEDLYFILRHEMSHFFHHDLWLKFVIEVLCMFYWWNPFCLLLRKRCDTLLEMRVDQNLVSGNPKACAAYLECLLRVIKQTGRPASSRTAVFFCSNNQTALVKRFVMLKNNTGFSSRKNYLKLPLLLTVVALYFCSYLFIFEASYLLPSIANDPTIIIPTPKNTYIIDNSDGTFSIYIYNEYFETTDSLDHFDPNIPIYNKGEYH